MVRQGRMTVSVAAKSFEVPSSTLSDRVRKPLSGSRSRMLTMEEEDAVSQYCIYQAEHGRPLRRKDIREHVKVF